MSSPGDRPRLWIFAGPNGSGKSSAYAGLDLETPGNAFWIVNPDILAVRIAEVEGLPAGAANLEAVIRIERWLEASIASYQSVGVETVLSTDKYRRLVEAARGRRFVVNLTYVILDSPERSIERVRIRVAKGGHDVPPGKIVERYWRSLEQLPWFLDRADAAWIYDNSGASPRAIAGKSDGTVWLDDRALPQVRAALDRIAGLP